MYTSMEGVIGQLNSTTDQNIYTDNWCVIRVCSHCRSNSPSGAGHKWSLPLVIILWFVMTLF